MCCLFGLVDYGNVLNVKQKEKIIKVLSVECEARGTDATGVAYVHNNKIIVYKRPLPARKLNIYFKGNPTVIMGHTRLSTQGSEKINCNNHPFLSKNKDFALAHNGILYNDVTLRRTEKLPETKIQTDSYIAVQLIDKKNTLSFDSLKFMAEKVEGSFCFTVLDKNNSIYIVKGDNPMAIAHFKGFYIYASTADILIKTLNKLNLKGFTSVSINEGDILKFTSDGKITKDTFVFDLFYGYPYWGINSRNIFKETKESKTIIGGYGSGYQLNPQYD
ncbi:MAG: glucosamine 6-phosphate synthetase, partial [Eubacterium sp.]|nr:glucosamine 6-phosphate synthetase [Eubacterium sp.]